MGKKTVESRKLTKAAGKRRQARQLTGLTRNLARRRADYMSGRQVEPIRLRPGQDVVEMVDRCFAASGFNGRRLAEACRLYSRMIEAGATIGLTLSGAMTPIGMQGILIDLMKAGFVDWIVSTGANLYHDLHRAFGFPVKQGHWLVDDNELADVHIARIYDTFIGDEDTLLATDRVIQKAVDRMNREGLLSTAEFHQRLGAALADVAPHPERSMFITAQECGVPVYTSGPGDSSIALALLVGNLFGKPVQLDPVRDVIETAAIVRASERNGVVMVGGGSPKNFYLQTQPALDQFLYDEKGGHDYFIQLTTDAPHWGGLSGATPSEAKSWGKIKDAAKDNVVVYSCASITLPLLAQYVLTRNKPRRLRRLNSKVDAYVRALRDSAAANDRLRSVLRSIGLTFATAQR